MPEDFGETSASSVKTLGRAALVLGELCLDIIIYNPRSVAVLGHPTWAGDVVLRLGGSASYAAQALRVLGLEVSLSGIVGDDTTTADCLARLREKGINTARVRRCAGEPTPKCVAICEEDGKSSFVACSPFPYYDPLVLQCSLDDVALLYFGAYLLYPELWGGPLARLFEKAKAQHILVALDTQLLPIPTHLFKRKALTPATMKYVDVLFANRREASALTGRTKPVEAAEELAALGPRIVVVKLGSEGCLTWSRGESIASEPLAVEARDPIGAGDYFGAAFAYGLLQGWNLQRVSDFANAFAALCISREKGKGLPSTAEALALLEG